MCKVSHLKNARTLAGLSEQIEWCRVRVLTALCSSHTTNTVHNASCKLLGPPSVHVHTYVPMHTHTCTCRVVIRGEPGEDAVLCTEGMSYEFRAADTSNVLLLVPSLSYPGGREGGREGGRRKQE